VSAHTPLGWLQVATYVALLLKAGGDIEEGDRWGKTPFELAFAFSLVQCVSLLEAAAEGVGPTVAATNISTGPSAMATGDVIDKSGIGGLAQRQDGPLRKRPRISRATAGFAAPCCAPGGGGCCEPFGGAGGGVGGGGGTFTGASLPLGKQRPSAGSRAPTSGKTNCSAEVVGTEPVFLSWTQQRRTRAPAHTPAMLASCETAATRPNGT
jgi:hypothetical protein